MTFTINPHLLPEVESRLAKLARRIVKMGIAFIPTFTAEERIVPATEDKAEHVVMDIDFNFDEFRLPGGWEFVATIEHGETLNIVHTYEGAPETPAKYRTDASTCDHCNISRERHNTIVVRSEDGEFTRVGTTCSRNYFGIDASKLVPLMREFSLMEDEEMYSKGSSGGRPIPTLNAVLTATAGICRRDGFKPAAFGEDSTREAVMAKLFPSRNEAKDENLRKYWAETSALVEETDVEDCLAWLAEKDDTSGWIMNLKALAEINHVGFRNMGLAVSLMGVYIREITDEKIEKREKRGPSKFIGEVKDRLEFVDGEIVYSSLSSGYGYYDPDDVFALIAFGDDIVSIKTSTGSKVGAEIMEAIEDGVKVSFKATVKEHRTDGKGRLSTKVTRAALIK